MRTSPGGSPRGVPVAGVRKHAPSFAQVLRSTGRPRRPSPQANRHPLPLRSPMGIWIRHAPATPITNAPTADNTMLWHIARPTQTSGERSSIRPAPRAASIIVIRCTAGCRATQVHVQETISLPAARGNDHRPPADQTVTDGSLTPPRTSMTFLGAEAPGAARRGRSCRCGRPKRRPLSGRPRSVSAAVRSYGS
ncbi:MAG: hypothetical protein QOF01_232 [Thermomicrobiales bacterium]|nr:hypothetical protein [Thermomicrobiales bacterium]